MGSWWRSEDMTYVSIIFSEEAALSCIRELGNLGCLQFTDLNPDLTPFQRRYVAFIKKCDEIERKIRYVNGEVKKMGIPVQAAGSVQNFVENNSGLDGASGSQLLETLESRLELFEQQLLELNKYNNKLTEEYAHKVRILELRNGSVRLSFYFVRVLHIIRSSSITCSSSPESFSVKPRISSGLRLTHSQQTTPRTDSL